MPEREGRGATSSPLPHLQTICTSGTRQSSSLNSPTQPSPSPPLLPFDDRTSGCGTRQSAPPPPLPHKNLHPPPNRTSGIRRVTMRILMVLGSRPVWTTGRKDDGGTCLRRGAEVSFCWEHPLLCPPPASSSRCRISHSRARTASRRYTTCRGEGGGFTRPGVHTNCSPAVLCNLMQSPRTSSNPPHLPPRVRKAH